MWYFDELVKKLLHGISGDVLMLVRNCMSFPAISPIPRVFKARDRCFWRNTWHRRSWTSHMSTMRRPVEWPFWGRNCWWLIGNQPYMEVLSNGHISWDNIGILFRSLGQQPRFLGVLSVFIEKMMVNQWILGCRTRFSDKPGPLLDTTSTSTDCCWYDLLGPWLHYMFTE